MPPNVFKIYVLFIAVERPPPRGRFTYIAYGDSITHGYCAEMPYPGLIGRLNNCLYGTRSYGRVHCIATVYKNRNCSLS